MRESGPNERAEELLQSLWVRQIIQVRKRLTFPEFCLFRSTISEPKMHADFRFFQVRWYSRTPANMPEKRRGNQGLHA